MNYSHVAGRHLRPRLTCVNTSTGQNSDLLTNQNPGWPLQAIPPGSLTVTSLIQVPPKSSKPSLQSEFKLVFANKIGNVLRNEVFSKALRHLRSIHPSIHPPIHSPFHSRLDCLHSVPSTIPTDLGLNKLPVRSWWVATAGNADLIPPLHFTDWETEAQKGTVTCPERTRSLCAQAFHRCDPHNHREIQAS